MQQCLHLCAIYAVPRSRAIPFCCPLFGLFAHSAGYCTKFFSYLTRTIALSTFFTQNKLLLAFLRAFVSENVIRRSKKAPPLFKVSSTDRKSRKFCLLALYLRVKSNSTLKSSGCFCIYINLKSIGTMLTNFAKSLIPLPAIPHSIAIIPSGKTQFGIYLED